MGIDELSSANDVAERFLDNIETVIHGKREQIKLVIAALMCGGHALLEDVPGTAKTVLAHPVHARPPADGRHRPLHLQPA